MNPQMSPQLPSQSSRAKLVAVVLGVLLILSLVFAGWAYSRGQDYKKNSDQKVAAGVAEAKKQQEAIDQAKFDEISKQPYKSYVGPAVAGTISFSYPKSWSAYVDTDSSNQPINGYFYQDIVPGIQGDQSFPLRVELVNTDYAQAVSQYSSQVTDGSVRSVAFLPPKLKDVPNAQPGVKLDGAIGQSSSGATQQGSMVILKVRDKTLKIYTETSAGVSDFNNIVLPSLTFVP